MYLFVCIIWLSGIWWVSRFELHMYHKLPSIDHLCSHAEAEEGRSTTLRTTHISSGQGLKIWPWHLIPPALNYTHKSPLKKNCRRIQKGESLNYRRIKKGKKKNFLGGFCVCSQNLCDESFHSHRLIYETLHTSPWLHSVSSLFPSSYSFPSSIPSTLYLNDVRSF